MFHAGVPNLFPQHKGTNAPHLGLKFWANMICIGRNSNIVSSGLEMGKPSLTTHLQNRSYVGEIPHDWQMWLPAAQGGGVWDGAYASCSEDEYRR